MSFSRWRDVILLIGGLLLLGYETLISGEPRVVIIGVAAAMMGLPASLIADRSFLGGSPPTSDERKTPPKDSPQ